MARKLNGRADAETIIEDDVIVDQQDGGAEVIIEDDSTSGVDPGIESLRKQLVEQTTAREAAEKRAADTDAAARLIAQESARNAGDLQDSRVATITNAIEATEASKKDLRMRLIAAQQAGDADVVADLTMEAATVATKLQRLNEGKQALENQIEDQRERAKNPPRPTDRVEAAVQNMSPRAAAWVRSHREVIEDDLKFAELTVADKRAQRAGLDPNSDAYFQHMDEAMGYGQRRQQAQQQDDEVNDEPPPRRQAAPAAPVSRGNNDGGDRPRSNNEARFKLTAGQREAAEFSGLSYREYYDNMTPEQRRAATVN